MLELESTGGRSSSPADIKEYIYNRLSLDKKTSYYSPNREKVAFGKTEMMRKNLLTETQNFLLTETSLLNLLSHVPTFGNFVSWQAFVDIWPITKRDLQIAGLKPYIKYTVRDRTSLREYVKHKVDKWYLKVLKQRGVFVVSEDYTIRKALEVDIDLLSSEFEYPKFYLAEQSKLLRKNKNIAFTLVDSRDRPLTIIWLLPLVPGKFLYQKTRRGGKIKLRSMDIYQSDSNSPAEVVLIRLLGNDKGLKYFHYLFNQLLSHATGDNMIHVKDLLVETEGYCSLARVYDFNENPAARAYTLIKGLDPTTVIHCTPLNLRLRLMSLRSLLSDYQLFD